MPEKVLASRCPLYFTLGEKQPLHSSQQGPETLLACTQIALINMIRYIVSEDLGAARPKCAVTCLDKSLCHRLGAGNRKCRQHSKQSKM